MLTESAPPGVAHLKLENLSIISDQCISSAFLLAVQTLTLSNQVSPGTR